MTNYQLTWKQKEILRTASNGLRDGSVKSPWILVLNRGNVHHVKGFPTVTELGVSETDFRTLLECGFLIARSEIGQNRTFDVMEQRIHDAVSSDFEDPGSAQPVAPTPNIRIEQGAGSRLNIAINSQDVTQAINASPSLPENVKARLSQEVETLFGELLATHESHPQETRTIEKHVRRLVEDVSESQPDKDDVTNSLSRLERASQALASFAGMVTSIAKIRNIVADLPFLQ